MSHFFDGLNCCLSAGKPKNNGFAKEEKHQRVDSKENGTRMPIFSKYTNDDVAPWKEMFLGMFIRSLLLNINFFSNTESLKKIICTFSLQFVTTLLMKNVRSLVLVIVRSVLRTPHTCKRYMLCEKQINLL